MNDATNPEFLIPIFVIFGAVALYFGADWLTETLFKWLADSWKEFSRGIKKGF